MLYTWSGFAGCALYEIRTVARFLHGRHCSSFPKFVVVELKRWLVSLCGLSLDKDSLGCWLCCLCLLLTLGRVLPFQYKFFVCGLNLEVCWLRRLRAVRCCGCLRCCFLILTLVGLGFLTRTSGHNAVARIASCGLLDTCILFYAARQPSFNCLSALHSG